MPERRSFAAEEALRRKREKRKLPVLIAVVVLAAVVTGIVVYLFTAEKPPAPGTAVETPPIASIAVLPFDNLSDSRDDEFFSDGVTDDIMTYLSRISGLTVISRTSTIQYKDSTKSIPEIAGELGVDAVLEGTVRRAGNRCVISVQLIDARRDAHLWANKYDREMEDIFAVQEDIARSVVGELEITLRQSEEDALDTRPTDDLEAYDLYLLGRHYMDDMELDEALSYFERAVELDPGFARAWAGIAHIHNMVGYTSLETRDEAFPRAKAAIDRALELDDTTAEAYVELAWYNLYHAWDWPAAKEAVLRAIELNPNDMWAHHYHRDHAIIVGDWDTAVREMERTCELDPVKWRSVLLPYTYFLAGRFEEAEELARSRLSQDNSMRYLILGWIYFQRGEYDRALEYFTRARELNTNIVQLAWLDGLIAVTYHRLGDSSQAERSLRDMEKNLENAINPNCLNAFINGYFGRMDEAFPFLERAFGEREAWVVYFKTFPEWKILREDPRGKKYLERLGLAD